MQIHKIYGHNVVHFQTACKAMSGKACSNSVVQAQKLVDQLQLEAGMERIKACSTFPACSKFLSYVDTVFCFNKYPFEIASNLRSR